MQTMKKILAVLLTLLIAVTMTATLVGCGDDEEDSGKKKSKKTKKSEKSDTSVSEEVSFDEFSTIEVSIPSFDEDSTPNFNEDSTPSFNENSNTSGNTVSKTTKKATPKTTAKKQPTTNANSSSTSGASSAEAAVDAMINGINSKNANQIVNAMIPSNSSLSSSEKQNLSEICQSLIDEYNSAAAEFSGNDWFLSATVNSKTSYTESDLADALGVTPSEAYEMDVEIMGFTTDGILIADEEATFIAYKSGNGWYACPF